MTASISVALWGTLKYEFLMQARRKALWISMAIFSITEMYVGGMAPWDALPTASRSQVLANWAMMLQLLFPVVFGILMADRLPRDSRLNVSELIRTAPTPSALHLLGKYLGSAFATALPIFVLYSAGVGYVVAVERDLIALPVGLAVFAIVMLPGLLFVGAFSIACPAILWVPLYQFLFVGYWFWGNALNPSFGIPTLTGTLLTPIGDNAAVAFFGIYPMYGISSPTMLHGTLSIALLLGGASVALIAVHHYLKWVRARE